mgnify:CR=1 FL=1
MKHRICLLVVLAFGTGCKPESAEDCSSVQQCPAGQVCIDGQCQEVCNNDLQCQGELVCVDGTCSQCENCRAIPEVTRIDGSGSQADGPAEPRRIKSSIVLLGKNLSGSAVQLTGEGLDGQELTACGEQRDDRLEVQLPDGVSPGEYNLRVVNQAGSCGADVTVLKGEKGEPGSYVIGDGLQLQGEEELSVEFAGNGTAATVARSDHTHDAIANLSDTRCGPAESMTGFDANGNPICQPITTTGRVVKPRLRYWNSGDNGLSATSESIPQDLPGAAIPLNLEATANVLVVAEGTQHSRVSGEDTICHGGYRLVVDNVPLGSQRNGQVIDVSQGATSHWDDWSLVWGGTMSAGVHQVRLQGGLTWDGATNVGCEWDSDDRAFDNQRMSVMVLPGHVPFASEQSLAGSKFLLPESFTNLGVSTSLQVSQPSDLVVFAGGAIYNVAGSTDDTDADVTLRLLINGTPSGPETLIDIPGDEWWESYTLVWSEQVGPGSVDIELQGLCDPAEQCQINANGHQLQRLIAFAIPQEQDMVGFAQGGMPVRSDNNNDPFKTISAVSFSASAPSTTWYFAQGIQLASSDRCHSGLGLFRNSDANPTGGHSHHGNKIVVNRSPRSYAPFALQTVRQHPAGQQDVAFKAHQSGGTSGECVWNSEFGGTSQLLTVTVPD